MKWFGMLLGLLLAVGCATGNDHRVPAASVLSTGAVDRVAVCIGLTAVAPAYYNGWAGECPGCDIDAKGIHSACTGRGMTSTLLLNEQATWANVRATILAAVRPLKRGDLLVLMISGHGGQVKDNNGDEADGLDETVCLWDGAVRDDRILEMIRSFPAGIRVVLISDQCHSEGNFRSFGRAIQRGVSGGKWGKKKGRALVRKVDVPDLQLIQLAGCREAQYSYGSTTGGTWTQSLLATLTDNLSWAQWFSLASSGVWGQTPTWVEYGPVTSGFRDGLVLK